MTKTAESAVFLLHKRRGVCYNKTMSKRVSYYVSRKNWLVWLSALLLVCSAIARICFVCEKGADALTVWLRVVLPVFAAILFVLRMLLDGQEHFYKTARPVALMAIYFAVCSLQSDTRLRYSLMFCALLFAGWLLYRQAVGGRPRLHFVLWLVLAGFAAFLVYDIRRSLRAGSLWQGFCQLHDVMLVLGVFFAVLCAREHNDGKYHPTFGDRKDGRRVRGLNPITRVANYIMPNRCGAANALRDRVEITEIERYIRAKRKEGLTGFGMTEVFLAAYVRIIAKYPAANRFLSGQTIYSRDEDIQFCMVIKKEMTKEAPDTIIKLHLSPRDTAKDVYEKFHAAVDEVHNTPLNSTFDDMARYFNYVPGVALKFLIWLFKTMDYFDLLPAFLLEVSPFHASVFFTSMASLGIPAITHHLYDFGNMPVFCAFGTKYRERELGADGQVLERKYMDYSFNIDERIVDGFYYAEALKHFHRVLRDPSRLDVPPETVIRDID